MPRILIIDDDATSRELVREALKDHYEIVETADPENALMFALQQKPDAILLDLTMPKFSGFELCQAFTSLSFTRHIPIFIISAEDARNKAFCESMGASGYFQKPIDFVRLKARLKTAAQTLQPERRKEARFQVRVPLKLTATNKDGTTVHMDATTDNMSTSGFLCSCSMPLELGAVVDVYLCHDGEHHLGNARVVRFESSDPTRPRYGCMFVTKVNLPGE